MRVPLPFVLGIGFGTVAVIGAWQGNFLIGAVACLGMMYSALEWETLDSSGDTIVCHDCLVEQEAEIDEPSGDGGFQQECVNCSVMIVHYYDVSRITREEA